MIKFIGYNLSDLDFLFCDHIFDTCFYFW